MDIHFRNHRLFNILTITLPLFCFLLSWTTTTSLSSAPPLSSSASAADILRTRGYTLFATALSASGANLSGTLFAPPDFAFSFSTSRRRKPTAATILFHTLPPPPRNFLSLTPQPFVTLHHNFCVFLSKSPSGELQIATSVGSRFNRYRPIKVRQPDLYVDHQLAVHGIDGVLDLAAAEQCPGSGSDQDGYEAVKKNPQNAGYLDHAIRVLRRRGFNFVATALAMRRGEVMGLESVTVFAPSDRSIFIENSYSNNGFRFDFLHHVVPQRLRFDSLSRHTVGFTAFQTLAANKSVIVEAIRGVVRVDGVRIDGTEIYFNRWIVVFAIPMTLDDAADRLLNPPDLSSPASVSHAPPFDIGEVHAPPADIPETNAPPADIPETDAPPADIPETKAPPADIDEDYVPTDDTGVAEAPLTGCCDGGSGGGGDTQERPSEGGEEPEPEQKCSPVLGADVGVVIDGVRTQSPPPPPPGSIVETRAGESGGGVARCLGGEIEGEDLYCPPQTRERKLQEADVEQCDPSDVGCKMKGKGVAESEALIWKTEVNVADDLFFYA